VLFFHYLPDLGIFMAAMEECFRAGWWWETMVGSRPEHLAQNKEEKFH